MKLIVILDREGMLFSVSAVGHLPYLMKQRFEFFCKELGYSMFIEDPLAPADALVLLEEYAKMLEKGA